MDNKIIPLAMRQAMIQKPNESIDIFWKQQQKFEAQRRAANERIKKMGDQSGKREEFVKKMVRKPWNIYCSREEFIERSARQGIYIWLTDYLPFSFISWEIKRHTKNDYNHVMIQTAPGFLCSQNWTFRRVDPADYLGGKHRVKLIRVPTEPHMGYAVDRMARLLVRQAPRYDWLGIFGFMFGQQKLIQFRSRFYCSEAVLTILQEAGVYLGETALSPGDIDRMIEDRDWEVVAIYDPLLK